MALLRTTLSQVESDFVWFAKGWQYWVDYNGRPKWIEGDNLGEFWDICSKFTNSMQGGHDILTGLVGKAIGMQADPVKEFTEFLQFFSKIVVKRFSNLEEQGYNEVTVKVAKGLTHDVNLQALIMILARWDVEEDFDLLTQSWSMPEVTKYDRNYKESNSASNCREVSNSV